jgi:hypothetical protein
MTDSPLVLVNLVIVSTHISLAYQLCTLPVTQKKTDFVTEKVNFFESFILDMVQRESLVPTWLSV